MTELDILDKSLGACVADLKKAEEELLAKAKEYKHAREILEKLSPRATSEFAKKFSPRKEFET